MTKDKLIYLYKQYKTQDKLAKELKLSLNKIKELFAKYDITFCNKKIDKARNSFIEKARKIHGDKYDYSEVNYIRSCIKVKILCKHCNKYFYQTPNNHLNGQGCPFCKLYKLKYNQQKSFDKFLEDARKIHGNKYEYVENTYDGAKHKLKILCKRCNKYFYQTPDKHLIGHGCPKCNVEINHVNQLKPLEQFINEARKIHGDDYDYSEVNYKGRSKLIKIKCNNCNQTFEIQPCLHLRGYGCKHCHSIISKGERKIIKWLKANNILFIQQKRFTDCKDKQCLPFDFYLPLQNICIEYQGRQHYEMCLKFDKSEEDFKSRQKRDLIKKQYCLKNDIKLIEVKYNENVEDKLKMEILKI